ncbi:hypothetical protein ACET3Z_005649 [Daucus carota]
MSKMPSSTEKVINLDKLLGNMPRLDTLWLEGFVYRLFAPGAAGLKCLTKKMENLKVMYLQFFEIYDLVQIRAVLCLIRSAPNLQMLDISLEQSGNAEMLLDPSVFSDHMILDQLETLKVINMVASPNEFQLIRLLLASSPSLKSFDFNTEYIIHDPAEELMITQEVRQIPRASRDAVIEWIF